MKVLLARLLLAGFCLAAMQAVAFEQERFAIGFWVDPPMDTRAEARYEEIADANFTLVIGGFGASTRDTVLRQIALCEQFDLKAIVSLCDWPMEELPDSPAVWGYAVRDEPSANDYPALAEKVAAIRSARPGKLAYINLFPCVASAEQLGTPDYKDYVERFATEVNTGLLSFDHYPIMKPGVDDRARYLVSLEVTRDVALRHGVNFWNFFNTMPYGPHSDPTEGQLRWQVYTSIAYGAKGVLYFCYYTPAGDEFPKGGAIIGRDDLPTRHYDEAKRINTGLKNLGPTIMQLTSTGVIHVNPGETPATQLASSPVLDLKRNSDDPEHDFIFGNFTHADGRRAVLLVNDRHDYTAWPTVEFDTELGAIREVCKKTGQEIPVRDDSPAMDGLQLSFDAGEGRLFILP
jgi:hypothetical protein